MSKEIKKLTQMKEHYQLLTIPQLELDAAVKKGMRRKERKVWKTSLYAGLSFIVVCLLFTLSIRTSSTFSSYVSQIPGLSKFVQLVDKDKGLVSALNNQYIQKVNVSDEHQGVKLTVDAMMVDQKRMVLFYHYYNTTNGSVTMYPKKQSFTDGQVEDISGSYSMENERFILKKGKSKLYKKIIDLDTSSLPIGNTLEWTFQLEMKSKNNSKGKQAFVWRMPISYDKAKVAKNKLVTIQQTVEIDGQKVEIQSASVSPTRTDVQVMFPSSNTKRIFDLKGLKLEDNNGHSWSLGINGLTSFSQSNNQQTYIFESNYYEEATHMYLSFEGINALNKDELQIKVDPVEQKLLKAPRDGILEKVRYESGELRFYFKNRPYNFSVFSSYDDAKGIEHKINTVATAQNWVEFPYHISKNPVTHQPITLNFTSYPSDTKKHIKIQLY